MVNLKQDYLLGIGILAICFGCSTPAYGSSVLLSNEKINILVSNRQSWTGKNGTGNLSYYGCDRDSDCVYLTGGTMTCRDGICLSLWRNKNYSYILSSTITASKIEGDKSLTTLTIKDGERVLSTEKLYPRPFDN